MADVERIHGGGYTRLQNAGIRSFGWKGVTVNVNDRHSRAPKAILSDVTGIVKAGEMIAILGPSGSGKSTLLNVLAQRPAARRASVEASSYINGSPSDPQTLRRESAYVEQEDALVGSLTVRETLLFAARLSLPSSTSEQDRTGAVSRLIDAFGLSAQAESRIGTSIRSGISGGQKRRVSVACQLITSPRIIFLDEPTSGLDSAASFEVISFIRDVARQYNLLVIASIHQPSTATFAMFDRLLVLSQGSTAFSGRTSEVQQYFDSCGDPIPLYMNPAEFILDFVNIDFARGQGEVANQLALVRSTWQKSAQAKATLVELTNEMARNEVSDEVGTESQSIPVARFAIVSTLIHRSFIKSYRDVVAYSIRIAMYMGLAIMMGTVWLRLAPD
ncbi:hypothetical protein LTR91_019984 [Friedmanniomyces endolithicus]|uniref:ABC transporter domain-containing protein n=1 Tax=Friedmanniomyces endolithicus TaxID=329885 RepID=A0AAN6FAL2_9PEZI|nr:hypothetical protein LTS00_017693 [Friedmanniomyces endolithicus]KAK0274198.1 hypothetical protein LTR35_011707 [Friedmanniomyces endolithicus]KAK0311730.1 hypothetical protein LTR82_014102 [Friedmanniomyces endolithicus]KAK0910973.1 hypothetical protein LTR57_015607 [Friedmanniomyces endolithicus]KAK0961255.1 hypothetical protein LTR91_019984 [Friedmanniomyces endolithicus]